jgi:acetolactate synthase-1/2/3 large subunit
VRPLIEAADLIVLAGYDPIEMRQGWRNPWPAGKPVIDIVAEPLQHGMHESSLMLEGAVGMILTRLADELPQKATWPGGRASRDPRSLPCRLCRSRRMGSAHPSSPPPPPRQTLREVAPAGTVATADSGAHRILFSQIWRCDGPRTLLQSSGLCTMGCALPLATGAALGSGRPTLCLVGDAGLRWCSASWRPCETCNCR